MRLRDRSTLATRVALVLEDHADGATKASLRLAWICGSVATGLIAGYQSGDAAAAVSRAISTCSREIDKKCAAALLAIVSNDDHASRLVDELDGGL